MLHKDPFYKGVHVSTTLLDVTRCWGRSTSAIRIRLLLVQGPLQGPLTRALAAIVAAPASAVVVATIVIATVLSTIPATAIPATTIPAAAVALTVALVLAIAEAL